MSGPAAERWATELAAWAIPDHIMAAAPESPWAFTPAMFRAPVGSGPDTPSRRRAREALVEGGSVLDVGCGGGSAAFGLVPPAGLVTGFDQSEELLALFTERATELGVDHRAVQGTWPAEAALVGPADVVVSNHVAYNVPDLGAFATALTDHARVRVVLELGGRHPRAGAERFWQHFWGIGRPEGPTADDAIAVLVEVGITPAVERASRPWAGGADRATRVASLRRTLCLTADRDPEIDALLGDEPPRVREAVTLSWDGTATG